MFISRFAAFYSVRTVRFLAAGALGILLLALATGRLQTAIANGDTRTLAFHHMHTSEALTVTFKRDGRYDQAALDKLNWFLRDWRRDEPTKMDPLLFDLLWEVHREVRAQAPITIISAFRSPQTNAMLRARGRGVARFSQHTIGKAIDFYIPGADLAELRAVGLRLQRGGVGFYPSSGSPFIHVDSGGVRHWPRLTRDQLARVFPDGKTVHIPADGKPMPGFALALAEIEARGGRAGPIALAEHGDAAVADPDRPVAEEGRLKRLLASLFTRREEDEDEADARPAGTRPPAVMASAPAAPAQTVVASLDPKPEPPRPRLQWTTGPSPAARTSPAAPAPIPQPRPTDLGEVTASLPPAITGNTPKEPGESTLAYASAESIGPKFGPLPPAHARTTRPAPAALPSSRPLPYADASRAPAALLGGARVEHYPQLHHPDPSSQRGLIEPVRIVLDIQFSRDSIAAPASAHFIGPAVVPLPTLAFDRGAGIVTGALATRTY